eukprot:12119801-Alexandrium_andersonii.AAC.1
MESLPSVFRKATAVDAAPAAAAGASGVDPLSPEYLLDAAARRPEFAKSTGPPRAAPAEAPAPAPAPVGPRERPAE